MLRSRAHLVLSIIFIFIFLTAGSGYSFNETQLQLFKSSKQCMSCDLSFADLTGGLSLVGAILTSANLYGAILTGANLSGANMDNVNLSSTTWIDGTECKPSSIGVCNR